MEIIYHNLLWVSISYSSTIKHISEQLIAWGSFLNVNLYHISFLPLSMVSTMGGLLGRTRTVALCMPVTFFLEKPLQMAFQAGQLSHLVGCEQVQLGHCEANICGLFFWG